MDGRRIAKRLWVSETAGDTQRCLGKRSPLSEDHHGMQVWPVPYEPHPLICSCRRDLLCHLSSCAGSLHPAGEGRASRVRPGPAAVRDKAPRLPPDCRGAARVRSGHLKRRPPARRGLPHPDRAEAVLPAARDDLS